MSRVPPSKYQPRARAGGVDPHGGEEGGDRGRGAHVDVGDPHRLVVDPVRAEELLPGATLDEDRAPRAGHRGGHDRERVHRPAAHVAVERSPVDPVVERALERSGIEQAQQAHPGDPQHLPAVAEHGGGTAAADDRPDDLALPDLPPALEEPGHRILGVEVAHRGQVHRGHSAHARAHQQPRALPARLEVGQEHGDRTGLVGASRATPGEYEPDRVTPGHDPAP
ncbi:MAG: hypothetical protein WKF31_11850 [Thermoleophilaceae bacterium]